MEQTITSLEGVYKTIKAAFQSLEAGQQLSIVVRYGNMYTNEGQFRKVMHIVKSKGRFRNPDYSRRDWTIKAVVQEIEWYKEHHFYNVEIHIC